MIGKVPFYVFSLSDLFLTIILAVICYTLVIEFSKRLKGEQNTVPRKMVYSLVLGFAFWLANLFISLSMDLPYSTNHINVYFQVNFFFCMIGSYLALAISQKKLHTTMNYLLAGLFISFCILSANSLGFYLLYSDYLQVQPMLMSFTALLTVIMTFSLLRFLIQMTNVEYGHLLTKWKYVGTIIGGATFAGVPYITLISMLNMTGLNERADDPFLYLVPFIYCLSTNLLLLLVPDLFGERLLLRRIQSYLSLFNENPDAVFSVDLKGNILFANNEALSLTGYTKETIAKTHIRTFVSKKHTRVEDLFLSILKGDTQMLEAKICHHDGHEIEVRITVVRIIVHGELIGLYGIVRDITEQKQAEETIRYLAYHDDLTGLPNKRKFEQDVMESIEKEIPFYIMYLDFDRFKRINDTFGHFYGDKILQETGKKLNVLLSSYGTIARLGGDEFAILLHQPIDMERLAKLVIQDFRNPILFDGFEFILTASIGISRFPEDGHNITDLLKASDVAMYQAKEQGANRYTWYESTMKKESLNKIKLESDLRKDLAARKLSVYYQPKFHTETNELVGSEALVRWKHAEQGFISPSKFIPIAEETNLIIDIERFVLVEVLETIRHWKRTGHRVPRTSINISVIHFYQEDFVEFIIDHLKFYEVDGKDIEIEITESVIMRGEERVNQNLHALREVGVEISVDDFGTGYSSLSYLQKLSVDRLKIDQSFISDFQSNKEIIAAIISMSHNLKLKVIAEGVETQKQVGFLQDMNCYEVQGYFYSPPVDKDKYEHILYDSSIPA